VSDSISYLCTFHPVLTGDFQNIELGAQLLLLSSLLLTKRLTWHLVQKLQGHVSVTYSRKTHKKDDMFGRQRKKEEDRDRE